MATQITNYQCPSCMGPLHFQSDTGMLKCDYCDSTFSMAEIEAMYAEQNAEAEAAGPASAPEWTDSPSWNVSGVGDSWGADAANMRAYNCPSCGAELICDSTTAATSCPYCGNPSIIPSQFSGVLKPDYVIPFRLDKDEAVSRLSRYYRGKLFLPSKFSAHNHIQEIKGVYVPFWLFDSSADARAAYNATRSHTHTEGDYRVTTIEHYDVQRAVTATFEQVPADGSSKMPNDYMDSIEPFDYSELQPFTMACMPGYLADKFDVPAEECTERINNRCRASVQEILNSSIAGYDSCSPRQVDIRMQKPKVKYALLPVWLLSTQWHDKNYLFAMNGQTGKFVGDLPVSKGKYLAAFAAIMAVIASICIFSGFGAAIGRMIEAFLA